MSETSWTAAVQLICLWYHMCTSRKTHLTFVIPPLGSMASKGKGKGLHSYIRQRGQLSYSIKSQLQEEKEARLNKTPEKEARGNMKLMYEEEKNE